MVKKAKLKVSARLIKKKTRRSSFGGPKHCRFCSNPAQEVLIDYKNASLLRNFLTERGKILPARISGTCCFHQRRMSDAIKKARTIALVAYHAPNY